MINTKSNPKVIHGSHTRWWSDCSSTGESTI